MRELFCDGEAGLASSGLAKQYYDRRGIKCVPGAKEQQAALIDRRGAFIRDMIHSVTSQCEDEGLSIEFKQIFSDFICCGNAMLSINGSTPYTAVTRRARHL